jgi:hypothetical protein
LKRKGPGVEPRNIFRWILDPWILLGAVGFGLALSATTLALLWLTRPNAARTPDATAAITVIALPTSTPVTPESTQSPQVTLTATGLPPPAPENISIDAYVQVTGTGGDGLRLRTDPGLDSDVRMLGLEGEVFLVQEGPQEVDGYSWWYLVGPVDETRRGWAVANYLAIVQNP